MPAHVEIRDELPRGRHGQAADGRRPTHGRSTDDERPRDAASTRVLIVDNYDSFTYNLAQELGELGASVEVVRNDAFTVEELLEPTCPTAW